MSVPRVLPIILLLLVLLLPATAMLTGFPEVDPLQENRVLALRPLTSAFFNAETTDFLGYTRQLEAWFSDQFGTRPFWVRLHTQILYSLFRQSDQVHIGRDNWLYYRNVLDNEMRAAEFAPADYWPGLQARMVRLTELLAARGITLYIMPLALKSRYYPEFLPTSAAHAHGFTFYDRAMDAYKSDTKLHLIDTRALFETAKQDGLKLFHQTDFHWTDPAGALAFKQLLNAIGAQEGRPTLANSWDYDIVVEAGMSGGQARAMPLFRLPSEDTIAIQHKAPITEFTYATTGTVIETAGVAATGQDTLLAPVFAFGDSFLDAGTRAGFFNFFSGWARGRIYANEIVAAYKNRVPGTRYMLIEYITSATYGMDNSITALIAALEADPQL